MDRKKENGRQTEKTKNDKNWTEGKKERKNETKTDKVEAKGELNVEQEKGGSERRQGSRGRW
jgi:hypothetical protein